MPEKETIYISYLEQSIKNQKDYVGLQCSQLMLQTLQSTMSVELKSFWVSPSNKYEIQTITRKHFISKSLGCAKDIILSGYVTDADGKHNAIAVIDGSIIQKI